MFGEGLNEKNPEHRNSLPSGGFGYEVQFHFVLANIISV